MDLARFVPLARDVFKLGAAVTIEALIDGAVKAAFPIARIPFIKRVFIIMGKVVAIGTIEFAADVVARKFQRRLRKLHSTKTMYPKRKKMK